MSLHHNPPPAHGGAVSADEQRYRSLVERHPALTFELDREGRILDANQSAQALLGHDATGLRGKPVSAIVPHWDDGERGGAELMMSLCEQERHEVVARHADGGRRHLSMALLATMGDGERPGYLLVGHDVTRLHRSIRQLRVQAEVLNRTGEAVVVLDDQGLVVSWNEGANRLFGSSHRATIGRPFENLFDPADGSVIHEALSGIELGNAVPADLELRRPTAAGGTVPVLLSMSRISGLDSGRELVVVCARDLSEMRRHERAMRRHTTHDALTGLPKRDLLLDRMQQAMALARRNGSKLAVLYIDLDRFKEINDSLGHDGGDELLRQLTARLSVGLRDADTLSRLGADEFVLLLTDLAHPDDVAAIADNILAKVALPFVIGGKTLLCTCSIGVALSDGTQAEPTRLIRQADLALDAAKSAGRNIHHFYSNDLAQRVNERLELRTQLHTAIEQQEFELHYQPQMDLSTQRISGVEVFVRWRHPQRGLIGPASFLPLAEETGQIVAINEWVLEQACLQHRRWLDRGMLDCAVAVNVSGVQFRRADFFDTLRGILARSGLPARRLELELSESVVMHTGAATLETLQRLHGLGVRLSLDNFGTGFSSLGHLKRLPIDKVKIDRSFVQDIARDGDDSAITLSVIAIAHHLRLRVVAEGVETPTQLAYLRRHLCDDVQGFLLALPLPASGFDEFLVGFRPPVAQGADPAQARPTLLLVDDEPNVLRALARALRRDGYRILTAGGPAEAFEVLAQHEVQVILSDQRMPQMCGTDFLSQVKQLYPHTVRMVLSGYTDLQSVTEAINRGAIYRFLTKPWEDEPLRAHVKEAFLHQQHQQSAAAESA